MKRVWISAVLLVLLVGGCLLGMRTARTETERLTASLQALRTAAVSDPQEALALSQSLAAQWESATEAGLTCIQFAISTCVQPALNAM